MTLREIIQSRLCGKVGLFAPLGPVGGDRLYLVASGATVPVEVQLSLWWDAGRFYTIGGHVRLHHAWQLVSGPWPAEAAALEARLGVMITSAYEKSPSRCGPILAPPPIDFG